MDFIKPHDYSNIINMIETKYEVAFNAGDNETSIEVKSACLSIMATLILIYMNAKAYDNLKLFEVTRINLSYLNHSNNIRN